MNTTERVGPELARQTVALLREAGVQLAIAESGTGGAVAGLLRDAGAETVLTRERIEPSAEALALTLRVSPAKVHAFGAISAMVAAEAAADLIDTYEGGWGLVVMVPPGNAATGPGVSAEDPHHGPGFIALGTPSMTIIQQCRPGEILRRNCGAAARTGRAQAGKGLAIYPGISWGWSLTVPRLARAPAKLAYETGQSVFRIDSWLPGRHDLRVHPAR